MLIFHGYVCHYQRVLGIDGLSIPSNFKGRFTMIPATIPGDSSGWNNVKHYVNWSVVTGTWLLFFHSLGNVIIPTDEVIVFAGVAIPPTSVSLSNDFLMFPEGFPMDFLWVSHFPTCFPMICPIFPCVFLWFSYDLKTLASWQDIARVLRCCFLRP